MMKLKIKELNNNINILTPKSTTNVVFIELLTVLFIKNKKYYFLCTHFTTT